MNRSGLLLLALIASSHLLVVAVNGIPSTTGDNELPKRRRASTGQSGNRTDCSRLEGFGAVREQIRDLEPAVKRILEFNRQNKHATYNELALFCDTFGPRLSGSKSLQMAIDYMAAKMRDESKLNITLEPAMIPKWEVDKQWARIVEPVAHQMSILALGGSVGTDSGPIEAQAVVVHSMSELKSLAAEGKVAGKIVVYNYKFTTYPESVKFRSQGALEAQKYKAVAALIRSVTPFSIYSPHTGMASKSIPTAAITVEDADLIERWSKRHKQVLLRLFMETRHFNDVQSFNTIGDITGSERPREVVLVSGHIDSWYNTAGAMDDGGGMMISYKALDVLNKLGLRGKRTIRAVLWTSEEFGLFGAKQYFENHKHELENFKAVIESDEGTFKPLGLSFKNVGPLGQCALRELLRLTESIETTILDDKFEGSDIELFTDAKVPGLSLKNENSKYFFFHHTTGDSITVEDPDELDKSTALFAITSYVLSNLDLNLGS